LDGLSPDDDNLEHLASALCAMGARIRTEGVAEGLAADCSRRSAIETDADAGSIPPTEDEAEFVRVAHCLVRVKEWPSP
jgi:hypothetical protein